MFQLVWTSPLVAGLGVRVKELLKSLEIRLSPTVSVERKFDDKLGIVGITGKPGKILILQNQSSKLVPTCIALSIGGRIGPGSKRTLKIN